MPMPSPIMKLPGNMLLKPAAADWRIAAGKLAILPVPISTPANSGNWAGISQKINGFSAKKA